MDRTRFFASATFLAMITAFALAAAASQGSPDAATLAQAQNARDAGDGAALQQIIDAVSSQAAQHPAFQNYVSVALFQDWACEIAFGKNDSALVKNHAEAGISAAEKAVQLKPDSSEALWLLGDLLSQLIPNVLAGGVRYGQRSTDELDKAIALDPRNANAYVSRAVSYYFTPAMFGGDQQEAVKLLQKAIALDPSSDAADTAHIWLAQIYDKEGRHDDAVHESNEALRLAPHRGFAQSVAQQVNASKKPAKSSGQTEQ